MNVLKGLDIAKTLKLEVDTISIDFAAINDFSAI